MRNGKEIAVPRASPGLIWEMKKALYIIEQHLDHIDYSRGLAIFIDRWAVRFMLCDDRELRSRFAALLAKNYERRYITTSAELTSSME